MYYKMEESELRSVCRTSIESVEKWARNIIDYTLTIYFGSNYFEENIREGCPIVRKDIREKTTKMLKSNPERFHRKIDTLFLDEIIYVLCRNELYRGYFKEFLDIAYPDGNAEARTFLGRLIPIRNCLSHSNPISVRDAERCICYSNDFIDSVKEYFMRKGVEQVFNVPNAIKLNDSLGNEIFLNKNTLFENVEIKDISTKELTQFHLGDKYSAWLTMDPAFDRDSYVIDWHIECGRHLSGCEKIDFVITEDMIRERCAIYCTIKSKKTWHRYRGYDQQFALVFRVLPPIE